MSEKLIAAWILNRICDEDEKWFETNGFYWSESRGRWRLHDHDEDKRLYDQWQNGAVAPAPVKDPTETSARKRKHKEVGSSAITPKKKQRKQRVCLRLTTGSPVELKQTSTLTQTSVPVVQPYGDYKTNMGFPMCLVFVAVGFRGLTQTIPFTCPIGALPTLCAFTNPYVGAHEGMHRFKSVTKDLIAVVAEYFEGLNATVEVCAV